MNYISRLFHPYMGEELFGQLDFEPNPLYEQIITDLMDRHFSLVPGFISPELTGVLRDELLGFYEEDRFKKAAIGNHLNEQVDRGIRGDFIYWLDRSGNRPGPVEFFEKVDALAGYLNRTCFLGIAGSEFHYALYPAGAFYRRHLDTFQNDDRRKLSAVCYLNPPDWSGQDGGELILYVSRDGREEPVTIHPRPGLLVLFESQLLEHEVRPARRQRLSLTGWMKTR